MDFQTPQPSWHHPIRSTAMPAAQPARALSFDLVPVEIGACLGSVSRPLPPPPGAAGRRLAQKKPPVPARRRAHGRRQQQQQQRQQLFDCCCSAPLSDGAVVTVPASPPASPAGAESLRRHVVSSFGQSDGYSSPTTVETDGEVWLYLARLRPPMDDDACCELAPMLPACPGLARIVLFGNVIGDRGAEALAAVLPDCLGLRHLNLNFNKIGAPGGTALAGALDSCPGLRHLNLAGNLLERAGLAAIYKTDYYKECANETRFHKATIQQAAGHSRGAASENKQEERCRVIFLRDNEAR
jgi:hypothetical protein